ncbi:MAG: hypothetical protein GXY08_03935 [Ruminococcus sp.]|nr:hypothetical protein [Ruminococcus sp.]
MDNSRMSTADMLQYCNEALAWDDFGPIDIFFFQSVKKILLGQCSAMEEPEEVVDDLMGIERPVRDVELEPEYGLYADIYYGEEGDDDIPDYSVSAEDEAFSSAMFTNGFFDEQKTEDKAEAEENKAEVKKETAEDSSKEEKTEDTDGNSSADKEKHEETSGGGFTVNL